MPLNRSDVARILFEKRALRPCHRCGNEKFTVVESYSLLSLQDELKGLQLGGPNIPVTLVACTNCGAITQHALGALGLLPRTEDKTDDGKQ